MSISSAHGTLIKAYAVQGPKQPLSPFDYEATQLGAWDIEVEITHCGLCHSDLHLINNDWQNSRYPLVPGHEIVGIIKSKGSNVNHLAIGQRVGIGWQRSACLNCEQCKKGDDQLCPKREATCLGHFGGFANKILADSRFAFAIPDLLSSENAAPLFCAGATVFSPLIEHTVQSTMRIGVIGIGGLGHLAIQFARAFGCEVTAFSSNPQKEDEAKEFGAHHFISSVDKKSLEKAKGSIDFLLSTVSSPLEWHTFIQLLRPKGTLCFLGIPAESSLLLPIFALINDNKRVCGSGIGSRSTIENMLRFAAQHHITAKTEVFPMSEANKALEKLAKNEVRYRAVLKN